MSQKAQEAGLPRVWHLPAPEGRLRSACGWREKVMRGDLPELHDHKLTRDEELCSCIKCVAVLELL